MTPVIHYTARMKNETQKNEQIKLTPLLHKGRNENPPQESTPVYFTRWISALIRGDQWFHLGCGQIARVRDYPKPKYSKHWYLRYLNKSQLPNWQSFL